MHTCYNYMSCEKEGKVLFVIQYQCNVSLSSLLQSVNTISNLLLVVSSPNMTVKEKTSDTTLETSIIEDDISGREKLFKNFIYNAFV